MFSTENCEGKMDGCQTVHLLAALSRIATRLGKLKNLVETLRCAKPSAGTTQPKIHIAIFWPQTYLMIKFSKLCMYTVQLFIKQIFKASSDQQ